MTTDRLRPRDPRQVLSLLLRRAVEDDSRPHSVRAHAQLRRRPAVGHLLVVDHLHHVAGAQAAVLLRPAERQPALLRQLLLEIAQELPALLAPLAQAARHAPTLGPAGGQLT